MNLRVLADRLDHPEGVCWCPTAGAVYAGGEAGQLYRIRCQSEREAARHAGHGLGVAPVHRATA